MFWKMSYNIGAQRCSFFYFICVVFSIQIQRKLFTALFLIDLRENTSGNGYAIRGCLLKSAGHGCTVTDGAETMDVCLKVLIDNDLVGIEFNFHAVKQCLVTGDTRSYLVEGL